MSLVTLETRLIKQYGACLNTEMDSVTEQRRLYTEAHASS